MENSKQNSILVITIGFTILGFFLKSTWPFYLVVIVGTASIISEQAMGFIHNAWFGLAKILGWVNSRILLTLIYYIFLLPLALISRLSGKESIIFQNDKTTYYTNRDHQYSKADLENPW